MSLYLFPLRLTSLFCKFSQTWFYTPVSWNLEVQRDTMTLDAVLAAQNPGLNPELIRAAFCETYPDLQPDFVTFHRRAVLDGEGKEFR